MTNVSQKKVQDFEAALEEAGLGHCLTALKGGEGAVRLQHVLMLKEKARAGRAALDAALAERGVSATDRDRLGGLLLTRLEALGGIAPKAIAAPELSRGTDAWRAGVIDEDGALPADLAAVEAAHVEPPVDGPSGSADADGWAPGMRIVNGHLAHSIREQGMIQPPNDYGYIHLAGEVERPRLLRRKSREKAALLAALKERARALREAEPADVRRADVFDAFLIPPGSKEGRRVLDQGRYDVHIAEFDVVVLVECPSVQAARRVRESAAFAALEDTLAAAARYVHCVTARNPKRIAEVDRDRDGVFLFNYFFAADIAAKGSAGVDVLLGVWEYTAGWWTAKANLTNSTPLQPIEGERSEYSLINHCRWDRAIDILPHLVFRPSLDEFVLANFTANDIMAMPVLYHLA